MWFNLFNAYDPATGDVHFLWLQVNGNNVELTKLDELLDAHEVDPATGRLYTATDNFADEDVVDALVSGEITNPLEYDFDFHPGLTHVKVTGTFTCPDSLGDDLAALHGDGIRKFFR